MQVRTWERGLTLDNGMMDKWREMITVDLYCTLTSNPNIKRNNAVNVHLVQETVNENWTLSSKLEQDLLNKDREPLALIKIDCEGCELHFLKGAKKVLQVYHPVMIIEIQDDETRRNAKVGGQRMIKPAETRKDVLDYLRDELGYTVEALTDDEGVETWDYLAYVL